MTGEPNPKDALGDRKVALELIPPPALIAVAQVFKLGARKYGPYNWRSNKVRAMVYVGAALRHVLSYLDGEHIDPESGESHAAHAMACLAIVLDADATGNLVDDRPTAGVAAQMIRDRTEK